MCTIESKINYSPKFSFDCLIAQEKYKRRKKKPRTQKWNQLYHISFGVHFGRVYIWMGTSIP